jgi:hypothetical protein
MKTVNVDLSIDILNAQLADIAKRQGSGDPDQGAKLTSEVMTMARGLAAYLAEQRKTQDDAEDAVNSMTPERIAALTLRLVAKLSPEYRAAVALRIEELDGKLLSHG